MNELVHKTQNKLYYKTQKPSVNMKVGKPV